MARKKNVQPAYDSKKVLGWYGKVRAGVIARGDLDKAVREVASSLNVPFVPPEKGDQNNYLIGPATDKGSVKLALVEINNFFQYLTSCSNDHKAPLYFEPWKLKCLQKKCDGG
jgi:hypothetical protein